MDYIVWDAGFLWDQIRLLQDNVGVIFNIAIAGFLAISAVFLIAQLIRSVVR